MAEPAPANSEKAAPYRVLALAYRPQKFADLVGQDHIKLALQNAIRLGKVAHAFLFAGSRGTGKTTTARILAKALNCLDADAPIPEPCCSCTACVEITASRDMDVMEIDGASNNSVDQIRELRQTIENKPVRDRYRLIIIDEVHMLSIAAFNALLKTLEEPPPHVKFIFATTDPHKVPQTIHSRCQHYDFRRLTDAEIVSSLEGICRQESASPQAGVIQAIADISDGGMRDAQSKLDQLIGFRGSEPTLADLEQVFGLVSCSQLLDLVCAMRQGKAGAVLDFVEEVFSKGKDPSAFLSGLLHLLRDMLVLRCGGGDSRSLELPADQKAGIEREAEEWSAESLLYALDILSDAGRKLKIVDFPRIVMETALVKLCAITELKPVGEIVATLDAMLKGKVALRAGADAPNQAASAVDGGANEPAATSEDVKRARQMITEVFKSDSDA